MINVEKLPPVGPYLLNETYQRILGWFFAYPDRAISLTDLCKETKTSKTTGKLIVSNLEKIGFLEKKVIGKAWNIAAVQKHPYFTTTKVAMNLLLVYESEVLSLVRKMISNPRAIVLFGSYRKGDDMPESDIDLATEVSGNQELKIIKLGVFPKFGYRKNVSVNLHIFSRTKIDINLFANIANGIVLEGFLEVRQ